MSRQSYQKFSKQYRLYKDVLDVPIVKTSFNQEDFRAMEYCSQIDFIALIIPFSQNATSNKYDCVILKNDLVTYTKIYSELYGSSTIENNSFLDSAILLCKKYLNKENLSFEELYPIAFLENDFAYDTQEHQHKGLVFVGRLSNNQSFDKSEDLSIRNISEKFHFSNPHNEVIFSIVKEHIQKYMVDDDLDKERRIANEILSKNTKDAKIEFLKKHNIDIAPTNKLKEMIYRDIELKAPKKFMDIACGNDEIIYELLQMKNLEIFANDIALPYIVNYHKNNKNYNKIVFTNFDAICAPFKQSAFDILLCKNLLHHIRPDLRVELLNNLLRIAKEVLLVEILHVDEQNENGKILHNEFYNNYLDETEDKEYLKFREIIDLCNSCKAEISIKRAVDTSNGIYAYMWIKK